MKEYTVYFEIYGKKMKAKVTAESEETAKKAIQEKIIFHKVEELQPKVENEYKAILDNLMDILGMGNIGTKL